MTNGRCDLHLTERRPRLCRLRRADVDFLLARHRPHVEVEFTANRGVYRLTPRGYAGVIVTPSRRLLIRPKVRAPDLLYLIHPDRIDSAPGGSQAQPDAELLGVFAAQLARLMAERSSAGLRRGYAERAESGSVLRGRLDLPAQLRDAASGRRDRLHTHFDELTTDILPNRLVRATAERILPATSVDVGLPHALAEFAEVGVEQPTDVAFARALADPLNVGYGPLLELCRVICDALSPGMTADRFGPTFLVELERLFERYITRGLQRHFAGTHVEVVPQPHVPLHDRVADQPQLTVRPDVVLRLDGRAIAVVDAKWKQLHGGPEPGDLHQLLAYAAGLGCGQAALVYPGRRSRCLEYALSPAGVTLMLQTLRVSGDRTRCRAGLRTFARRLVGAGGGR